MVCTLILIPISNYCYTSCICIDIHAIDEPVLVFHWSHGMIPSATCCYLQKEMLSVPTKDPIVALTQQNAVECAH